MYVVTDATGHIGKVIVSQLLTNGKKVRAIGSDTTKLRELSNQGATPLAGDINETEFVQRAFTGAEAVVLIIPENPQSNDFRAESRRISSNYVNSVRHNKIRNVVIISSIGAQLGKQAGIEEGNYELEKQFSELTDINVINLRSAFLMERLLSQVEMITHTGTIGSPLKNNVTFPLVSSTDVGTYATRLLTQLNFKGNTTEYILGQRDLTPNEITGIIAQNIGRPDLKYVQLKGEEFIKGFKQIGYSENIARGILEWGENINTGRTSGYYKRTSQNTTSTSLEQFAQTTFAEEYHMHEVTI